jgi:hypothetical protein
MPDSPYLRAPSAHHPQKEADLRHRQQWVILDEVNVFTWPGFDLRPIRRGESRVDYGFLPPKLFDQLILKFSRLWKERKVVASSRDQSVPAVRY